MLEPMQSPEPSVQTPDEPTQTPQFGQIESANTGDAPDPIEQIVAELNAFEPSDDDADNEERLQILVDSWQEAPDHDRALPAMLGVFERYPECSTLGDPSPLVHAIEEVPGYERELLNSLDRQPSYYGVWMLNRILGSDLPAQERGAMLKRLHEIAGTDSTPAEVRAIAEQFIGFQEQ